LLIQKNIAALGEMLRAALRLRDVGEMVTEAV
jgi:hypothetical protein